MANKDILKRRSEEADKIIEELNRHLKSISHNIERSKALLANTTNEGANLNKLNKALNQSIKTSQETLTRFNAERVRLSSLLTQVNSFYTKKYEPLANSILNKETGLQVIFNKAKSTSTEISKFKENSSQNYEQIRKFFADFKRANARFSKIDSSVTKLFEDTKNKNLSIQELYKSAKEIEDNVKKTNHSLLKLLDTADINQKKIQTLLLSSEESFSQIDEIKSKGTDILSEIQRIYGIAAETGLSGEFDKRSGILKSDLKKWENRILIYSGVLLAAIIGLFIFQLFLHHWNLSRDDFDFNFYVRFLIASPIVYYLYFCSTQYNQTNALYEKYNFKTTLAMSIKHHLELLISQKELIAVTGQEKVLDFILDGFKKIYTEPHTNDDYRLKLKIASIQLDVEKKLTEVITKVLESKLNTSSVEK